MQHPVKFIMQWNIRVGREESYFEFITQQFPAHLMKSGIQLSDAWYTLYGDWPQVMMGFIVEDLETLQEFLKSDNWVQLRNRLLFYITDYRHKAVPARNHFQL